jgi:hypothetical protein
MRHGLYSFNTVQFSIFRPYFDCLKATRPRLEESLVSISKDGSELAWGAINIFYRETETPKNRQSGGFLVG